MSPYYRKKPTEGGRQGKADRRSEAEDVVAAFLAAGGTVNRMPSVQATEFACGNCGHTGVVGATPGKTASCPRCRSPLRS